MLDAREVARVKTGSSGDDALRQAATESGRQDEPAEVESAGERSMERGISANLSTECFKLC